jgi:hypothetical protein
MPGKALEMEASAPNEVKPEHDSGFPVTVTFNGLNKALQVRPHDTVKQVLDRAIAEFGNPPNPHTLALYSAAGVELPEGQTVQDARIRPHDTLLLRTSAVKGG